MLGRPCVQNDLAGRGSDSSLLGLCPLTPTQNTQSKAHDLNAWTKACDNAHAQLEHQMNRITNLELLLRYGANAWRAQTQLDEALVKQLEGTLQSLRK